MILFPIIVTILGLIYIVSPLDFLPEIALGPIGIADDILVILIIIATWMFYFSLPLLNTLLYFAAGIGILVVLFYFVIFLYKKAYGNKKIKVTLKK